MTLSVQEPRTILLIATNPKDTARLRLDQELRDIAEGLRRSQRREQFHLEQRLAVRPRDLQRALLDVNPQIVHFSGHGTGDAGLLFEDESGDAKAIAGPALAALFALFADQVQCVVLNGCYSQVQAQTIAQHIPWVIGMGQEIGDRAAIEFAVGFYDALGSGRSIEFAYQLGCSALQLAGIAEPLIPVLLKGESVQASAPTVPEATTPITTAPSHIFNIAGSTITNLTGAGSIHYQEAAKPMPPQKAIPPLSEASEPEAIAPSQAIGDPKPGGAAPSAPQQVEVFFSYSHRDEALRDEMAKHLSILKRQGVITAWYDRDIEAGTEWAREINDHLNSAQVILLLISPDFIASDYCFDIEMKRAMERHAAKEACVIPVILRPVDWGGAPFSKLQAFPKDAKPVTSWANQDEAFVSVAQGIRRAIERLASR